MEGDELKIYRKKTFLKEVMDAMNVASKRYINEALSTLCMLKSTIQGLTRDSLLIHFADILGNKSDKRHDFAVFIDSLERIVIHSIEEWEKKKKHLFKCEYQSKRARNKALREEYTRDRRKLIKRFNKGKINYNDFKEQYGILFREGSLYKKQRNQKKPKEGL